MPVACHIDHGKKRIVGLASGTLDEHDLFEYQKLAGTVPDYNEIFDGTAVDRLREVNLTNLKKLAGVAAAADVPGQHSKLAIVAPKDLYFGLGRMYESFRECIPRTTKETNVFHSREEAEEWLDTKEE
jgi:hypothetical protein